MGSNRRIMGLASKLENMVHFAVMGGTALFPVLPGWSRRAAMWARGPSNRISSENP